MGYFDLISSYTNQTRVVEAPASGRGQSQNGKFSYGYASSAGKRSSMEDFFETRIDGIDGEIVGLFGVFDGHGGARAAEYVKRHLFSNLITHPKFISDTKSAIADAYNHTDSELLKSENSHTRDAGSTASTAILVGDRLLVANVGDSRAVICRGGNAFAVSRDHKPDQSDERERIENAGGFVMWAGTWRVGGVLAVSRAFGDRLLKQYVVADPEIQEEKIDDSLEFLILASDGLWDVFSNEEAVAVVKEVEDPEESTKKLVGEAIKRGSKDNITCVVVRFLESKNANNNKASSSQEANQGKVAARNDLDHKISAKKTNQEDTTTHIDLDRNPKNEKLNQKPDVVRNDDSGQPNAIPAAGRDVSSEEKGSAGEKSPMPITIRGSSEPKSSAKHTGQGQTTVHDNQKQAIAAHIGNENWNQKPVAARNDDSGRISSIQKPNAIPEAGRGVSSEQRASDGEKNQIPITIQGSSEAKSSGKHPSQEQKKEIAAHIDLDCNSESEKLNHKPDTGRNDYSGCISSTQKSNAIPAAGHDGVSSEQRASAGEKNQIPITIHGSSEPSISAKHPSQGQTTVGDSQKQANAASHTTSLEQRESTGAKNGKPNTIHSNSASSKASSVHSNTN